MAHSFQRSVTVSALWHADNTTAGCCAARERRDQGSQRGEIMQNHCWRCVGERTRWRDDVGGGEAQAAVKLTRQQRRGRREQR